MSELSTASRPADRERPLPSGAAQVGAWSGYGTLLRWGFAQIGSMLPLIIVIQAILAAGIIVGFGFLIPGIDSATAMFLSTGAPTVLLLTIGLVIVPQGVARARIDGTFNYMRTLPVARPLVFAADLTVWAVIALPSVAVAVFTGWLRYDLAYSFNWPLVIAASLLITLMATAVGYAIAVSVQPMLAQLITQVLVFFVMLFSPITFAPSQLPGWFQTVHDFLPLRPGGDLLRAGLASDTFDASGRDLLVLSVWCIAGVAITIRALVRRH